MKPLEFQFDFLIPQRVMFQSSTPVDVMMKIFCLGGIIDFMPVVSVKGFVCMDQMFRFVENNYELFKAIEVAAMDEYKRLHTNAKPIELTVVELAEYGITNIHPSLQHLN